MNFPEISYNRSLGVSSDHKKFSLSLDDRITRKGLNDHFCHKSLCILLKNLTIFVSETNE